MVSKSTASFVKLRKISRDEKPSLVVKSGETIDLELPDFSGGLITRNCKAADLKVYDFAEGYALAGPIQVDGAEKNDILEIEFLEFEHHGWGYTAIFSEPGLEHNLAYYPEERFEPYIIFWEVKDGFAIWDKYHIRVPINPFLGAVGTAPLMNGTFNPLPPRECGGNIDVKHLTAGTKLYLPVNVEGAHLFVGDCHLAMGDGEVLSSAIEAPLRAKFRVTARKDLHYVEPPMFVAKKPKIYEIHDAGYIGFMGIARTVDEATDIAIHKAMTYLCRKLGMTPAEAAILLGVVLDLTINEIPDIPNKVVSGIIPLSIFEKTEFP